ncbi:hypothetical protein [Okeania sp.]|uniref:hypothetical protein n=1 Tax=Okeania sp. TaxID=3100323 RepID=UPI002B4B539C|nr:hypothetical protein [Okeania sp.]MEB3339953.1 hypothetical protein [Okeania sp.]
MNNSLIEGLTKEEETLFFGLINQILAQKSLLEASSTSTEKQFQLNFKVDKNASIDVDSIQLKLVQVKQVSRIISTIFSIIYLATFALVLVVLPAAIISILINSVIWKIFALIGWLICLGMVTGEFFNSKTNWMNIISGCSGLIIIVSLTILLSKVLS